MATNSMTRFAKTKLAFSNIEFNRTQKFIRHKI